MTVQHHSLQYDQILRNLCLHPVPSIEPTISKPSTQTFCDTEMGLNSCKIEISLTFRFVLGETRENGCNKPQ